MKSRKNICVYSAPLKKNVAYYIRRDRFESDAQMEDYIKKIRERHKKENREYKEQMLKKKYRFDKPKIKKGMKKPKKGEDPLLPKREDEPIQPKDIRLLFRDGRGSTKKEEIEKSRLDGIQFKDSIELLLDQNTGNTTVLFGSSKKGKSTLMMGLYKKLYKRNKKFISSLFATNAHIKVYESDEDLLKCNVFNKQSEKYIKLQKYINSKTNNKYNFLNMFDDVINTKHKGLINDLIMTYRNSNISTMMCLQYGYLLSKMNRANVNNVIIFGSNSNESIEDLINTFLKPYMIRMGYIYLPEQIALFKHITKNHGFFYINNAKDHISFHRIKR